MIGGRDSFVVTALSDITDRSIHTGAARFTMGLSPAALAQAYFNWGIHLAFLPGKRLQLVNKAARKAIRFANYAYRRAVGGDEAEPCIKPLPQDRRFGGEEWKKWPFNFIHQAFLLNQQWWHNATSGIRGVTKQHENMTRFISRQLLDMFFPSNFLLTNPEVLRHTVSKGGANLVSGFRNLIEDWERTASGKKPMGAENFKVGRDVAVTPGKVIHRRYQVMTKSSKDRCIDPESYLTEAPRREGSWWPEWVAWLAEHSGAPVGPPSTGAREVGYRALCNAPGTYVPQE
jgi:polyhydroxyalkanoate synthase